LKNTLSNERLLIYQTESHIKGIIIDLISRKETVNSKIIQDKLQSINKQSEEDKKLAEWNKLLKKSTDEELTIDELEEMDKAISGISSENGFITDEDISNAFESIGFEKSRLKESAKIDKMSLDERYRQNHFDKKSIIQVFGYCWSTQESNGDPFVPDGYKSLVFHIADYIFNANNVSRSISHFNDEWVRNFLKYCIKNGFPKIRISNYTPFNIIDECTKFQEAKRQPYKVATFKKLVKHLKRYIQILQKEGLLNRQTVDYKAIEASNYLSRKTTINDTTRVQHTLVPSELLALQQQKFDNTEYTLARDMYLIQVFAGGLRLEELYSDKLNIQGDYINVYRFKTKQTTTNPIFNEFKEVLQRYNFKIPSLLTREKYRLNLKQIAEIMNFNRKIESVGTTVGVYDQVETYSVKDIFKPYSARKTLVLYLYIKGFTREQIIEFTGHQDIKTLKYYLDSLPAEEKARLVKEKITDSQVKRLLLTES
jgi:site-specific recombinase XerD